MTVDFFASPNSIAVIEKLEENGHEAVFVGGAVRDFLLGKQATDFDIATSATPEQVKDIFKQTVDIGIEHGTVLVLMGKEPFEVTTYRTENVDDEKSLREDLLRRDFTINALALTKDETIIDLFNGQADLENKIIRAVESPEERFLEDPLRMIRAVRFASVLDFAIEEKTFETIRVEKARLESVSIERIKVEFDKLFTSGNPVKGLQLIVKSGVGEVLPLFPRLLSGIDRMMPFHTSKEGWAAFMMTGKFTVSELVAAYKLSNDEKQFLSKVQKAYEKRDLHSFQKDELYCFDVDVLYCVEKVYCSLHGKIIDVSRENFIKQKALLPIQSKKDLVVNGKDLIQWAGGKGGRWVGEWIERIEYAVLHGHLENHLDTIKEWFINDFDSER